jgi:hypothetical protein
MTGVKKNISRKSKRLHRDWVRDREKWLKELDKTRERNWTGRYGKSSEEIQDEDRAYRV